MSDTASIVTADGVALHMRRFRTAAARCTAVVLHGYAEHGGRYGDLVAALQRRGASVFAADFRGHGRSPGARGDVVRFTDYHLDVDAVVDAARSETGRRDVVLFAHSMGGLVAVDWLLARPDAAVTRVALSSPFLGLERRLGAPLQALVAALARIAPGMHLPAPLRSSDLCEDEERVREHRTDPLVFRHATPRWLREALAATRRVMPRAGELRQPFLVLFAGDDRLVSPAATARFAEGLADCEHERLGGHLHEILNGPPERREPLVERFADWLTR